MLNWYFSNWVISNNLKNWTLFLPAHDLGGGGQQNIWIFFFIELKINLKFPKFYHWLSVFVLSNELSRFSIKKRKLRPVSRKNDAKSLHITFNFICLCQFVPEQYDSNYYHLFVKYDDLSPLEVQCSKCTSLVHVAKSSYWSKKYSNNCKNLLK